MSNFFAVDLETLNFNSVQVAEQNSLVFVDDSSYEFVGGGAASTNGF